MTTFIIGILAGLAMACQTAINARLRLHLGKPLVTSLVSFAIGLSFLLVLCVIFDNSLLYSAKLLKTIPIWAWCGGLLGMTALTVNVLIFPKLGGVQTAVMPILGQVLMGVLIDSFGWLNAKQIALSPSRLLGISLVLFGVFMAVVLPNLNALKNGNGGGLWAWRGLGVVGGMALATQAGVNGELGRLLGSPLSSAVVSFLVGTLGLLVVVAFYEKSLKTLTQSPKNQPFWIWSGGILAGMFIFASVWLTPKIGTGSVVMLMLLGLIIGSLLVDGLGLFGVAKKAVGIAQLLGVCLLLLGVACIRLWSP